VKTRIDTTGILAQATVLSRFVALCGLHRAAAGGSHDDLRDFLGVRNHHDVRGAFDLVIFASIRS